MEKIEEFVVINSPHGLHARPAALFVQIARSFDSSVMMEKDGELVDGKSIIAILSLGINKGVEVKLIVEGSDALAAVARLKNFLENSDD